MVMTAIGVLRGAYDKNTKIPDELSVVGVDDIYLSEFTIRPLSTVPMWEPQLAKICIPCMIGGGGVPKLLRGTA